MGACVPPLACDAACGQQSLGVAACFYWPSLLHNLWLSYLLEHVQFQITKTQMVEQEKARIKKEYERRESTIEVKKKVSASRHYRPLA